MNIDGRSIATDILSDIRDELEGRDIVVRAVVMSPSPATESYLRIKQKKAGEAGMYMDVVRVPEEATTEEVIGAVQAPGAHAVIVQLPLPSHINTQKVLESIPEHLDADVLNPATYARFEVGEPDALLPPVAAAVEEVLARTDVEVPGKSIVVIGSGRLVGQPVAAWFERFTDSGLTVVTKETENMQETLLAADIVVTGAGVPGLIKPEHLKQGVVLIDAGTSESNGQVVGDADPECAKKASVFTPVPGGIGPIAVACLFRNTYLLVRQELQEC